VSALFAFAPFVPTPVVFRADTQVRPYVHYGFQPPPIWGRGEPMCSPSSRPPRFMPFTVSNDPPFFCRGRPMCLPSLPSPPLCPPRWFSGRTRRSAPTFITAFNHPPFGVGANLRVCPLCVPPDPYHSRFQTIPHSSVGADLCVCPLRLRPLCAHPGGFQGGHAGPPLRSLRLSTTPHLG